MIVNLLISYKYIEYQNLSRHPYKNSKYELLNWNSIQPKIEESSNLLDQESNMQLYPSPF
jgi:hypothetical protein